MEYEFISGVYFLKEMATGLVKIGKSGNCKMRIQSFNTFPYKVEFLYFLESKDAIYLERSFKRHFEGKNVNGEWYRLSDNDIMWIQSGRYSEITMYYVEDTTEDSLKKIKSHLMNYKNFIWESM